MSIQALREQKSELSRQANHLLAEKGSQVWAKEDQTKFDDLADQIERVDSQIAAHQKMLDAKAGVTNAPRKEGGAQSEHREGVEIFLRKNLRDMSVEEALKVRNTMSTTTGSQGGYTVPSQVSSELIDLQKDYGGIRRVASQVTTAGGNDMSFATTDGTAEVGEIVAQNATAASSDPTFGTAAVNVVKFGSKIITIPIELLQDSAIDVVAMVQKRVRDRIGRIQNQKFSIGTGTAEPFGITVAASVGKTGTTGQTTTVIYDDLIDLVDSIDVAYLMEGELTFMFGQTIRKTIRKIKDTSGRPIWTPSYEGGAAVATPDLLLGYPVNINNDMPTPAANAVSISFGQHKKYLVRDAMEVTLFRFDDSAYVSKGQVGFMAWARAGGNLLDTAGVKTYKHSAT